MSYDVCYEVEVDGAWLPASDDRNYTSNVSRIWREAGCDIAEFHGRPVGAFRAALIKAITTIEAEPDRFRAMNPANGWGDADGCVEKFLWPLLRDSYLVNQSARVFVSR